MMKMHRKNIFSITLLVIFSFPLTLKHVSAQDSLSEQERALDIIADFAERLCKDIPLKGKGGNIELSGKAKVELSGIIKKIVDLGVEGAAKYQKSEYEGLLQEDLVKAIKDSTNCRLQVWNDLKVKILNNSESKTPPIPQNTPYAIFDVWESPRFSYGTFPTDNDCLDKLFIAQKQLDSKNAAKCARLPKQMWCISIKEMGFKNVDKVCRKTKKECIDTLALHKMEVEAGGIRVMTSCELVPWNEL